MGKNLSYYFTRSRDGVEQTSQRFETKVEMLLQSSFWLRTNWSVRYFGPDTKGQAEGSVLPLVVELDIDTKEPVIYKKGAVWIVEVLGTEIVRRTTHEGYARQVVRELSPMRHS